MATALLSVSYFVIPVAATSCPPKKFGIAVHECGRVENHTPWAMKWANFGQGSDTCFLYNYNNGEGSTGWSPAYGYWLQGAQHKLPVWSSKGGYEERVDVDGITYDRKWNIVWENGHREELGPGQWAKISSGETVVCTAVNGVTPVCRVKCNTHFGWKCIGA
ncbi:hypothetical protein LTR56_005856 [Elasticomyces elasticus]|nr:hypothetical protein LTR56_005856 [Elasticomyces elasticus]KAK3664918.1 hypothetical protein LTR22_004224 [Elasticomyces elasticus]KAK4933489.1 hypothetical protein LTR49_000483 [Elasticomyces elasticus]KAK5756420.1 hypothetical protein LTS12_013492 [Elasticomyces elasticus]